MLFSYNSKKPSKISNVTRITNRNILYLFAILVIMSVACAIGGLVFSVSYLTTLCARTRKKRLIHFDNRLQRTAMWKDIYI